jgi:trk system potassium uptake protein TrkH
LAGDIKVVLRDIGALFIAIGIVTIFAIIVPLVFHEYDAIKYLLLTAGVFLGIGSPLVAIFRNVGDSTLREAMITAALGWLLIALIGCIPFLFMSEHGIGYGMDFLSAFFESVAGWTGTGLTMVAHENSLPYTLQFYRSLIQWVGGVGVIVLTLAILARPGTGSYTLYRSEAREQKIRPSILSTVRAIWWIFLLFTVVGIILLWATGVPVWEAINHCMTGLATGGFSVTDDSMVSYSVTSRIILIFLMIAGAIAFAAHYDLLNGKIKKFFSDPQTQALIFLIIVGGISLTIINFVNGTYGKNILLSLKECGFQFVSAITCTGFYTANIANWSNSSKLILSVAMIIGGAAGSTAGGIKLFRAILLAKGMGWRLKKALSPPRRVLAYRLGKKILSKDEALEEVNEAAVISFLWMILLFVGIIVIASTMKVSNIGDALFEVCSAQGNVGLSVGLTSADMPPIAKLMLIFNMWIGRLEIIPVVVLFKSIISRRT